MRPAWLVAPIVVASSACSLLVDTSGYAGSERATPLDAAPPPRAADASADADAGAVPFCDRFSGALYCNDFDHGAFDTFNWHDANGGTLSLDGTDVRSAPNALLGKAAPTQPIASAYVDAKLPGSLDAVKLSFSVRLAKLPPQPLLLCAMGVAGVSLQLVVNDSRFYTQEQEPSSAKVRAGTTGRLAADWTRIELSVDLRTRTSTLVLDGKVNEQVPLASTNWAAGAFGVTYGIYGVGSPSSDVEVHVDDVLIERL